MTDILRFLPGYASPHSSYSLINLLSTFLFMVATHPTNKVHNKLWRLNVGGKAGGIYMEEGTS